MKEYKEILGKREEKLVKDYPDTLTTKNGMAEVLEKQGKYEDALKTFEKIYEKRKEKLGEDHPDTLTTRSGIAEVLEKQGKHDNALRIFQEVYGRRKEALCSNHPDTLATQNSIEILKKKQGKNEEGVQGSAQPEECLPTGSSSRKKREAKECELSWEDKDEFNEEKDEIRDLSKININSEKFINYVKNLPQEKRTQLIQLASEVKIGGNSQGLVSKLTNNQKVMSHLGRVGRVSGMTMHGMMAKNVLADFLNGNYQGVAINVGFIVGGQGFAKVAQAASLKGLELASEGKLFLGRSLKAASPFLARGTSAFVIYDLVNQVK